MLAYGSLRSIALNQPVVNLMWNKCLILLVLKQSQMSISPTESACRGTEERKLQKFRDVRDQIDARLNEWLAATLDSTVAQ